MAVNAAEERRAEDERMASESQANKAFERMVQELNYSDISVPELVEKLGSSFPRLTGRLPFIKARVESLRASQPKKITVNVVQKIIHGPGSEEEKLERLSQIGYPSVLP